MKKHHCDTCGIECDPRPFECVIFTKHLGNHSGNDDITGVRCYPCDDKITDAMLKEVNQ